MLPRESVQLDPLVYRSCGGPLKAVAYVTDSLAIRQILQHLDLSPPEKPPSDIRDVAACRWTRRGERSTELE